jgi:hypothetical protein
VAAVNSVGTRPLFSSSNSHVELAAPGVGVLSTVPQVVANGLGPSLTLVVGSRRYITRMGDLHWMVGTPARAFAGPIVRCSAADVCPRNSECRAEARRPHGTQRGRRRPWQAASTRCVNVHMHSSRCP